MMLFLGITAPFLGLVLLGGAGFAVYYQRSISAGRRQAQGKVIDLAGEIYNPGSTGVYRPIVRFHTPDGLEYEFKSEYGSRPAMYKVGQMVTVVYDPVDPERAEIRSSVGRWLVPAVMAFFGLGFICGGCFSLVFYFIVVNGSG
jgi:hypothetical protein